MLKGKEEKEQFTWDALPNDIIIAIARVAESFQRPILRQLNRHWRDSIDYFVTKISISDKAVQLLGSPTAALKTIQCRFPRLDALVAWKMNNNDAVLLSNLV